MEQSLINKGTPEEPLVLAIDFDGVMAKYRDPFEEDKGEVPVDLKNMNRELQVLRYMDWRVIVWTNRKDELHVVQTLKKWNVPFDEVNLNPWAPPNGKLVRKIHADVYLDDKGITFDGNWKGMADKILRFNPWWWDGMTTEKISPSLYDKIWNKINQLVMEEGHTQECALSAGPCNCKPLPWKEFKEPASHKCGMTVGALKTILYHYKEHDIIEITDPASLIIKREGGVDTILEF